MSKKSKKKSFFIKAGNREFMLTLMFKSACSDVLSASQSKDGVIVTKNVKIIIGAYAKIFKDLTNSYNRMTSMVTDMKDFRLLRKHIAALYDIRRFFNGILTLMYTENYQMVDNDVRTFIKKLNESLQLTYTEKAVYSKIK